MSYHVEITEFSQLRLFQTSNYIKNILQAPEAANKWLDSMMESLASLCDFPYRCPVVEKEPWHRLGYRQMSANKHIAYYRVKEEKKTVVIIAVVAARMNQESALKSLPEDRD